MASQAGRPGCPWCDGKGRVRDGNTWHLCRCRRVTQAVAAQLRAANQRDDRPFRLPGTGGR